MTRPSKTQRTRDEWRKRDLAAIHIAKAQLGLDDDTYRDLLRRVSVQHGAQCSSAGDLSREQRQAVISELQRQGATKIARGVVPAYHGKPANFDQLPDEIAKIEAQLADMGLSWGYADAICNRMFRIPRVGWCRQREQLVAILSALHVEQRKRALGKQVSDLLADLRMTPAQLCQALPHLPTNWRRQIKPLQEAADWLLAKWEHQSTTNGATP